MTKAVVSAMRFCYANYLVLASPDISACYSCCINLTELSTENTGLMDQFAYRESGLAESAMNERLDLAGHSSGYAC